MQVAGSVESTLLEKRKAAAQTINAYWSMKVEVIRQKARDERMIEAEK